MPYRSWITVSFLTPLFFRYHLPLKRDIKNFNTYSEVFAYFQAVKVKYVGEIIFIGV